MPKKDFELFTALQNSSDFPAHLSNGPEIISLMHQMFSKPVIASQYMFTHEEMAPYGRDVWTLLGRALFSSAASHALLDLAEITDESIPYIPASSIIKAIFDYSEIQILNRYHYNYETNSLLRDITIKRYALNAKPYENTRLGEDPKPTFDNIKATIANSNLYLYTSDPNGITRVNQKNLATLMLNIQLPERWIHANLDEELTPIEASTSIYLSKILIAQMTNRLFDNPE